MARRGVRITMIVAASLVLVAAVAVFLIAKRPVTMPRYDAQAWSGTGERHEGWLELTVVGSAHCWYLATGDFLEPDTLTPLVFPDTYRTFEPALAERGMSGPSTFIGADAVWAGPEIARPLYDVTVRARPASDDPALQQAADEWSRLCADADVVLAVEPGTLETT